MVRIVGRGENLGFVRDDYKNYLKTKRTIQIGDTSAILEYWHSRHLEDPSFFNTIQVDQRVCD